ncbi:MAG TPA: AMP-binding protein [Candidatus Didemnitutus sp.]
MRSLGRIPSATGSSSNLVVEASADEFRAGFAAALAGRRDVFLGNPAWSAAERTAADAIANQAGPAAGDRGWLMIPTGGSSGSIRFARHDGATIAAAVQGFTSHFGLGKVNVFGVLPLFHVGGLMAWMRNVLTGGDFLAGDWREISSGVLPIPPERTDGWLLSLVPTQLERLLARADGLDWLHRFRVILVGGAPAWSSLLDRAAEASLPVSVGYGMTETAAMVSAVRPEDFLRGDRSSGRALPHAHIAVGADGVIAITGESVCRGYFPDFSAGRSFVTEDLGSIDENRRLHVLGRRDGVIITGGEKVFPDEVEAALRATGQFTDVVVVGLPHREWGQEVVAAYASGQEPDLARVQATLLAALAKFKHPKRYIALSDWPRSDNGKVRRSEIIRSLAGSIA